MELSSILDLDDKKFIAGIDKSDMLGILERFPDHVSAALNIPPVDLGGFEPDMIAVIGMGGSAICGDILQNWLFDSIGIPLITVRGYDVPASVNSNSLVFAVSYSGNTEETLAAFEHARDRSAKIVALSLGGELEQRSLKYNIPFIKLQPSEPLAPRAAIAYLLFPIITTLSKNGLLDENDLKIELEDASVTLKVLSDKLGRGTGSNENQAKQIAQKMFGYHPVIFSYRPFTSISYRWRTQLNENAKILAKAVDFPEMNHNDIVGWTGEDEPGKYCVIMLRDLAVESERMEKRIELTKDLALSGAGVFIEVNGIGKYPLSRILSLLYIGDFVSAYLAILRKCDPTPVEIIENLKKRMKN